MSMIVDDSNNLVDPEDEVRKLQDLVKKLERQNQILRNKQDVNEKDSNIISLKDGDVGSQNDTVTVKQNRTNSHGSDKNKGVIKKSTLEDFELLDIDHLTPEKEDEWLYSSPRKPSPDQKRVSPYKWVREDLDHPSPEVDTVRKSLLYKLDEASNKRVSRSSSSGTVGSLVSPSGNANHQEMPSAGVMPSIRQPLKVKGLGLNLDDSSRVNTGTFTRKKKDRPRYGSEDNNNKRVEPINHVVTEDIPVVKNWNPIQSGSSSDSLKNEFSEPEDMTSSTHRLADVTDVQVLARMQEDSLRKSFTSPRLSPRKSSLSKSQPSSGFSLLRSQDNDSNSPLSNSARSSPGRFESDIYQNTTPRSNNSLQSLGSNSPTSTPPDSPYGSHQHLHEQRPYDATRQSMPNLSSRLQNPSSMMASPASDTRLSSRDSPSRLSPSRLTKTPGIARGSSPARTMSPQRSGIPSPRGTGIPRPGSSSKLPGPRRSGIPSPAKRSFNKFADESWKDGCF